MSKLRLKWSGHIVAEEKLSKGIRLTLKCIVCLNAFVKVSKTKDSGKCKSCAARVLRGGRITQNLDRIVQSKRDATKRLRYRLSCISIGCNNTVKLTHKRSLYCRACADKEKQKEPFLNSFKKTKRSALERGIEFSLSFEDWQKFCLIPNCYYCGAILNRSVYRSDRKSSGSLADRVDNLKGYSMKNIVPCCADCNFTKNSRLTAEEMKVICLLRKTAQTGATTAPGTGTIA